MQGLDARQARMWNYFNRDDTGFYPARKWPEWAQRYLLSPHRGNGERYALATFLLCNGMFPPLVEDAALGYDVVRHGDELRVQRGRYDQSAVKDVRGLLQKYHDGVLQDHTYYDMTLQRVVKHGVEQVPPKFRE